MAIRWYQVDAFTSKPFGGNPAAVCLLEKWMDDATLQAIAVENNLSETAFLVEKGGDWELRWFTPATEVDLCGHATLASAFVLFSFETPERARLSFHAAAGVLTVERKGETLWMDFPSRPPGPPTCISGFADALGLAPAETRGGERDLLVVFDSEEQVRELAPDFEKLKAMEAGFGVIATAPGEEEDFVSRFFAPKVGIDEDPVTGSAHCTLIPFWAHRLGKDALHASQVSRRGGEILCEARGERVGIGGRCVLFAKGEIVL